MPTSGDRKPAAAQPAPRLVGKARPVLITGGSGFIGSNLADSFLAEGRDVLVFDDLSRPGVEQNLEWLSDRHGSKVHACIGDVRDAEALHGPVADAGAVFHLAAQTAVTTSLDDPLADFEINVRGTINVLEAVRRRSGGATPVILSSTNKVYGALGDIAMVERAERYQPADADIDRFGIGESRPLDFCTPYGCSKGAGDQYVLDYAHSFAIPTAVLRMSCIYGPRQFGTEDQGWVAHFLIRALEGKPITVYGDGKQVRDVLHVGDAVRAYRRLLDSIDGFAGRAFNLGGGPANAVSLNLVLDEIAQILGRPVPVERSEWRPGDQLYFVADTRAIEESLGWRAEIGWREGLRDLATWLRERRAPTEKQNASPRRVSA